MPEILEFACGAISETPCVQHANRGRVNLSTALVEQRGQEVFGRLTLAADVQGQAAKDGNTASHEEMIGWQTLQSLLGIRQGARDVATETTNLTPPPGDLRAQGLDLSRFEVCLCRV
jgi:hypothetical protein